MDDFECIKKKAKKKFSLITLFKSIKVFSDPMLWLCYVIVRYVHDEKKIEENSKSTV